MNLKTKINKILKYGIHEGWCFEYATGDLPTEEELKKEKENIVDKILSLFEKEMNKIIAEEPSALIPRTKEHLEAYATKQRIRNEFREELRQRIKKT